MPRPVCMRLLPLLLQLITAPSARAEVGVSWEPRRVVLGRDTQVVLQVRVPPGSGPVRAAASSGAFASDRLEGGPVRTFHWTPPAVRYPLTAVLTFWVEGPGEPSELAVLRIPLLGQTTLDVSTAAGASVVVVVGEARFGPVRADARGKARVPVEVPPGVRHARVLATRGDLNTDAAIPLDAPQHVPLVAALTPSPLPKEGGWLLLAGEGALEAKHLKLSAEDADLSSAGARDVLLYRVKPDEDATSVTVTVRQGKGRDATTHTVTAAVATPEPVVPPKPELPTPPEPAPPEVAGTWRPSLFLLAGGAFAGGANTGPLGAVGVSLAPPWWGGRYAAELEVGLRGATFMGPANGLGEVSSEVLAVPVLMSVRAEVFQRARFTLYGRAGGGVVPFRHLLTSDFQEDLKESKLAGMGFLSVQGAYRFGRWSALAEVRGAWAPARTPWLDAQLGGLAAFLGLGFTP